MVLVSTGLMTMRALDAAKRLEADHVDVAVLHDRYGLSTDAVVARIKAELAG